MLHFTVAVLLTCLLPYSLCLLASWSGQTAQMSNPKCKQAAGCGPWEVPMIPNPDYKGVWKAPKVDNPDYKGAWAPRRIPVRDGAL